MGDSAEALSAPPATSMRLLDLFCGAGGASQGYVDAGFGVVGVDHKPQPHYPYEFVQMDVLLFGASDFGGFDAIHASPPCQRFSALLKGRKEKENHLDLVGATRNVLRQSGLPYVIENVPGAPLIDPVVLCGSGVGLPLVTCRDEVLRQVRRHRLFETNFPLMVPGCSHTVEALGVYGNGPWNNNDKTVRRGGYQGTAEERRLGMNVPWMNRDESAQAIPPAFTEFIGTQLLAYIRAQKRAPVVGAQ